MDEAEERLRDFSSSRVRLYTVLVGVSTTEEESSALPGEDSRSPACEKGKKT